MGGADEIAALLRETDSFTKGMAARFGYVEDRPVGLRPIADALVTRTTYPDEKTFTGAVYDGERRLIRSSQRVDPQAIQPADSETAPEGELEAARRLPRALYGGMLFLILGHFLFESAARLWLPLDFPLGRARRRDRMPVIYHPCPGFELEAFMEKPFLREALSAFGIERENLLLADESFRVDLLYVPDPLSIYHEYVHPQMTRLLDHLVEELGRPPPWRLLRPARAPVRRVFLSRARWELHTRIANEAELEEAFRARGFAVVHPQDLEPGEVMRLMREVEVVASSDGSHAHLLAFARPGTRCLHLDTRPVPTQTAIEKLRGLRAHHVPLFVNPGGIWDEARSRVEPALLGPLIDLVTSAD